MHKLAGAGLSDVYLLGGVRIQGEGDEQSISYSDLDGLYREIARAIALRCGVMNGEELRFLRKRLGMSQADVAATLGGKTEQVVAKWEKGQLPVPKAEANLLRLSVLSRFGTKDEMARVVSQLAIVSLRSETYPYVMKFANGEWKMDEQTAIEMSRLPGVASQAVVELDLAVHADVVAVFAGETPDANFFVFPSEGRGLRDRVANVRGSAYGGGVVVYGGSQSGFPKFARLTVGGTGQQGVASFNISN